MSEPIPDVDDAGIFALVVLATIAFGAALLAVDAPVYLIIPAAVAFVAIGEIAARKLAAVKRDYGEGMYRPDSGAELKSKFLSGEIDVEEFEDRLDAKLEEVLESDEVR